MRGWKPVERTVPDAIDLAEARALLESTGFSTHVEGPEYAVLRQSGTQRSTSGADFPLEVAVAQTDQGLHLQMRYDTFVLFDTGDLEQLADELAAEVAR